MRKLTTPAAVTVALLLLALTLFAAGAADDADSPAVADLKRRVAALEERVKKLEDRNAVPAPPRMGLGLGRAQEARVLAAKTTIAQFGVALDMFEIDNGRYPTTDEGLSAFLAAPANLQQTWKGPYIKAKDGLPRDPWDNPYHYRCPGKVNEREYDLLSAGPDGKADTADDISNWGKPQ